MLWAVHITNSVLDWPWVVSGFVIIAVLLVIGSWRLHQDEVPRVALLTAAAFIASSIHVSLGLASVHLLLNGLVGIVLGWRAAPAIFVGTALQAALLGHGGYLELGVNSCVLTIPALVSWGLFRGLSCLPGLAAPPVRAVLVAAACSLWFLAGVLAVALLVFGPPADSTGVLLDFSLHVLLHPVTLTAMVLLCGAAAWLEQRLENAPEFPLGLLVGEVSVLLTIALSCTVMALAGEQFGDTPPRVLAVAHLPVAAIEGMLMGFTVGYLARVKPELLGVAPPAPPCYAESGVP